MDSVETILREGKERRAAAKRRRQIIETFRRDTKRSIPSAIMYLVVAMPQVALLYFYSTRLKEFSSWGVIEGICLSGTLCFWLGMAVRKLRVSPRDKLLLLLIDEALQENEPDQSPPAQRP